MAYRLILIPVTIWLFDLRLLPVPSETLFLALSSLTPTKRTVTSTGSFHVVPLKAFSAHLFHLSALPPLSHLPIIVSYISDDFAAPTAHFILPLCLPTPRRLGRIPRAVASINQHLLNSDDVVSCCLDLGAPSMSFRINGQPVQGMFEDFNTDGFFFPVVSFSAGVK